MTDWLVQTEKPSQRGLQVFCPRNLALPPIETGPRRGRQLQENQAEGEGPSGTRWRLVLLILLWVSVALIVDLSFCLPLPSLTRERFKGNLKGSINYEMSTKEQDLKRNLRRNIR